MRRIANVKHNDAFMMDLANSKGSLTLYNTLYDPDAAAIIVCEGCLTDGANLGRTIIGDAPKALSSGPCECCGKMEDDA